MGVGVSSGIDPKVSKRLGTLIDELSELRETMAEANRESHLLSLVMLGLTVSILMIGVSQTIQGFPGSNINDWGSYDWIAVILLAAAVLAFAYIAWLANLSIRTKLKKAKKK